MVLCGYAFLAGYIHAFAQYTNNLLYYKTQEQKAEYQVIFFFLMTANGTEMYPAAQWKNKMEKDAVFIEKEPHSACAERKQPSNRHNSAGWHGIHGGC